MNTARLQLELVATGNTKAHTPMSDNDEAGYPA
jgi:hypothetical protein